jgi:hypothetical protein
MDSPDAPPAPDYQGAAEATAAGNLQNLNAQTWANRPTQVTPFGSSGWTTSVDDVAYQRALADWQTSGADPQTRPTQNSYVRWTQNLTLTPEMQASLDAQQQVQMNQSQLAQAMQGRVADTMAGGFTAPSLSSYVSGVPGVTTSFTGFRPTGVGGVSQQTYDPNMFTGGAQRINQTFDGTTRQNLDTPQFSDDMAREGAKAAYEGATALIEDDWATEAKNLDAKLRLQGLTPGSEAYDNAVRNQQRTVEQARTKLANDAVLTGAGIARDNYGAALAGYGAGNQARSTQFGQDATTFGLTNDARSRALDQGLSIFGATLQGQGAGNTAQQQAFTQALAGYGADTQALQASNEAQDQAMRQALSLYGTSYSDAYNRYMLPLNSMNAVLTGQQVQNPTMPAFATAGYTGGADRMGATSALGSWNQGLYNSDVATTNANNQAAASMAAAALAAWSDVRLKKEIVKVGERNGVNWYRWTWKNTGRTGYGVLAHEVPHAAVLMSNGYLAVDYTKV